MNFLTQKYQVSVIVPSWNNIYLLKKFIPNFKKTIRGDTKLFIALNEATDQSAEYLRSENIDFVSLTKNYGTLSVDFLHPFLNSEFVVNMNDDSLLYIGWDQDLIKLFELDRNIAATQVRGVEKGYKDGIICIGDNSLPNWLDEDAESVFFKNVESGKYKCDLVKGLFHPICCKTMDFFKVGGYSEFDENWIPGHSLDTYFAWKLWNLYSKRGVFLCSNSSFYYHGSSLTNQKVARINPAMNNRHNSEYFYNKTGLTHRDFHSLIGYGQKY